MTTFVDTTTGQVLGVVDGRDSASVAAWLGARSSAWRDAVEVVAIDPSAAFRKALREHLPRAAVSVDAFHLVKLANDALTQVRQRVSREQKQRRGRSIDQSWANRRLLLRAGNTLSTRGLARLEAVFASDDPTDEISAAWAVKEQLRRLLRAGDLADANHQRLLLAHYVDVAAMPETTRLLATVNTWWDAIEVLIVSGVTNAPAAPGPTADGGPHRGREHQHQAPQADRSRPPQPRPLPGSYPPRQCRPTRGMNTHPAPDITLNCEEPASPTSQPTEHSRRGSSPSTWTSPSTSRPSWSPACRSTSSRTPTGGGSGASSPPRLSSPPPARTTSADHPSA